MRLRVGSASTVTRFVPTYEVAPEDREIFEEMTEEMVELRLTDHRDRLLRKLQMDASQAPIVMDVSHANHRPILRFDRARRPDIPEGPVPVQVHGETYMFQFKKIAVNVAVGEGSPANVLPDVLRRLLGPSTGQPGIRHRARLVRDDDGWRLERESAATLATSDLSNVIPFPRLPFFSDVEVACGAFSPTKTQDAPVEEVAVKASVALDPKRHFVVTANGDSMNGGDTPVADGDLVLCEWTRNISLDAIEGKPFLLVGHDAAKSSFSVMKVPRKSSDGWVLESWNPAFPPQKLPPATSLEPVARVLEVVQEPIGLVLWGEYNRDAIAAAFGSKNDPSWKVGHRDIDVLGEPHTILMVTLRKESQKKVEHRYADRFLSPSEFQWESQASTKADSLKGRRITGHKQERRRLHLFVQYDSHQNFAYLGEVTYVSHEGEMPMRVRFELQQPLPENLGKMWM